MSECACPCHRNEPTPNHPDGRCCLHMPPPGIRPDGRVCQLAAHYASTSEGATAIAQDPRLHDPHDGQDCEFVG